MSKLKVNMPKDWSELSDEQLSSFFRLITSLHISTIDTVMILSFFRWSDIHPVFETDRKTLEIKHRGQRHVLLKSDIAAHVQQLAYLRQMPDMPVRISRLHGHTAVDAYLEGATFETYIACDNLYQGYLQTNDTDLLQLMAEKLYSCKSRFSEAERTMILYWWSGLKTYLSATYPDLYRPLQDNTLARNTAQNIIDSVNAQLRALTKGDITKEREVLKQPLHRALTELNALAREYDELKRKAK